MNDLISRQQAIDYFVTNVGFHDEDGYPIEDTDELRKIWTEYFSGIPSAEPKRAKWIATTALQEGQITWRDYKCSNCSHHRGKPMNFCEVCGAKMER